MNISRHRILCAVLTAMLLLTFSACGASYNAVVLNDQATELIDAQFYTEHYTSGIYLDGLDSVTDSEAYPRSRTFIVDSQEAYAAIFKADAAMAVNFETEMLLVCTYTSNYVRPVVIRSIRQTGSTLAVTLKEKRESQGLTLTVGAACAPYQRYVILKLDKLSVTHIDLTVQ